MNRSDGALEITDCLITMDGAKGKDWTDKVAKAYNDATAKGSLQNHTLLAFYDPMSVVGRMDRDSGGMVEQTEAIQLYTREPLDVLKRDRKLLKSQTTRGNVIGPFTLPEYSDSSVWKVQYKTKKNLYGHLITSLCQLYRGNI